MLCSSNYDFYLRLNSAATTETLVQVMTGMSNMMKQANSAIDIKNVQQAIEVFAIESEKQNFLQGNFVSLRQNKLEKS